MLPSKSSEFASAEYWDEFFLERSKSSFEWYGEFEKDLLPLVVDKLKDQQNSSSSCLVLGCGNSTLSEELITHKCATRVVSVDFSIKAIEEMKEKTKGQTNLEWILADVTNLPTDYQNSFETVWDKGALDALLGDVAGEDAGKNGKLMLNQVLICLKPNGIYYCVSLLQGHVFKVLLDSFFESDGKFEELTVRPFNPVGDSTLCPFLIIIRKATKDASNNKSQLLKMNGFEISSRDELIKTVHETQSAYRAKRLLRKENKSGLRGTFSLTTTEGKERFKIQVVDTKKTKLPFAALILPQGREHEWTFSSEEGQMQIAESNEISRLLFISLGRNQQFDGGMEMVQKELSPLIHQFSPNKLPNGFKIPFLAVSQNLGERKVILMEKSKLFGDYVIEDVQVELDDGIFTHRRLIFMNNPSAIQSEVRLIRDNVVDTKYLAFEFHRAMCYLTSLSSTSKRILVCGVGGGGLINYLHQKYQQDSTALIEGIEIDPDIISIGKKYFGLNEHLKIYEQDAYEFLQSTTNNVTTKYDCILIDIDFGGDSEGEGLIFPPKQFLDTEFLIQIAKNCFQNENGLFILNFGCRSLELRKELFKRLAAIFPNIIAFDMREVSGDLNIVICASVSLKFDAITIQHVMKQCTENDDEYFIEGLRRIQQDGSIVTLSQEKNMKKSNNNNKKKKKKKKG